MKIREAGNNAEKERIFMSMSCSLGTSPLSQVSGKKDLLLTNCYEERKKKWEQDVWEELWAFASDVLLANKHRLMQSHCEASRKEGD